MRVSSVLLNLFQFPIPLKELLHTFRNGTKLLHFYSIFYAHFYLHERTLDFKDSLFYEGFSSK